MVTVVAWIIVGVVNISVKVMWLVISMDSGGGNTNVWLCWLQWIVEVVI